jgi:alkaline phosphatase D
VRRHGAPVPHTLAEYRARHALYKRDADLQAAHAAHPWILTWDDHEVVNDYAADRDPAWSDPQRFLRRRAAAYRAYFEHMPLALPPQGASMRIHDRFAWGRLAELWTLDCRQYRSHHACPDPAHDAGRIVGTTACAELADPARSMLGTAQEAWLAQGLAGSTRRWKLLGQSTQISSTGSDSTDGRSIWTDGWDGYPLARRRLLEGVAARRIDNVVVLGGDVHANFVADLRLDFDDAASPVIATEFCGTSITSEGMAQSRIDAALPFNPHIRHARGDERGSMRFTLDARELRAELRVVERPLDAASAVHTAARFVVEAGRAGAQRA